MMAGPLKALRVSIDVSIKIYRYRNNDIEDTKYMDISRLVAILTEKIRKDETQRSN